MTYRYLSLLHQLKIFFLISRARGPAYERDKKIVYNFFNLPSNKKREKSVCRYLGTYIRHQNTWKYMRKEIYF